MSSSLFDLTGKVALITGATHGLGMAMAKGIGQAGAMVIINGNSSQKKIDKALKRNLNKEVAQSSATVQKIENNPETIQEVE